MRLSSVFVSFLLGASVARADPVIVELFTSEGCSSCPPADAVLARLAKDNPSVIPLAFHVDYWNRLGWADPYSAPEFTARQESYGPELYTPEMVVAGGPGFVAEEDRAEREVESASRAPAAKVTLRATRQGSTLSVEVTSDSPGDLWFAITEDGLTSHVLRGENAGRTLTHVGVVRRLLEVASSARAEIRLDPAWNRENLHLVAWLQRANSRSVLGATTRRVP